MDDIFKYTMANMTWMDIQKNVDKKSIVLIPLGVIEEHGPQLCLGTDIYTAKIHCHYVKQKLEQEEINAIIAPPFYWGICQSTGSFIGSFRIRKETAKNLLVDIISSLNTFGFKKAYGINAHGDIEQNITIIEAFKEASEKFEIEARYVFSKNVMQHYGITGNESYICAIEPQTIKVSASEIPDIHAGDIETATINTFYPDLVDIEMAKSLLSVKIDDDQIMKWLLGGCTKELSENGYLGNPSEYKSVLVMENINDIADRISKGIISTIRKDT